MRSKASPLALALLLVACAEAQGSSGLLDSRSPWIATAVGRVDSANEARHLPASTDGILAKVFVRRGEQVTAGQPLIAVDCSPQVAEAEAGEADAARAASVARAIVAGTGADREIARAAVDAAIAELSNEDGQLRRADDIYRRGFLSRSGYDTRVQRHVAAQSTLRSAKAQLDNLEGGRRAAELVEASAAARAARHQATRAAAIVEQCTVKSPIAGQVLQILRREGEHSGASQGVPLIVIADLSRLVVRAEVGERDAAQIRTGQRAEIWIDGNNRHWSGTVTDTARIMGRRSARSLDPTDRFDRDIREVFIAFDDAAPPALVGLRVTVGLLK
jgi:multidrug resistance efflux pump